MTLGMSVTPRRIANSAMPIGIITARLAATPSTTGFNISVEIATDSRPAVTSPAPGVLEEAEARIGQLEAEAAADQQAQAEAQPVIDAINQLAGQKITLDMKDTVKNIRKQYNKLSDAARSKVTNYNILTEAEAEIEKLEKEKDRK